MKLKENQKIYIRGGKNAKQGKRVIKELERRGGVNENNKSGMNQHALYYIRHNGTIDLSFECDGEIAAFIKEYYTEVKVDENDWPKKGSTFFIVGPDLEWDTMVNKGDALSKSVIISGNCFHGLSEADEVARQFREIIKKHKNAKKTERDGKGKKV